VVSVAVIENILTLLNKDTVGLASVPEVVLMRAHRKYYEETAVRGKKLRNYMLQFRHSYRINDLFINSINKKITDIADSATSVRQAILALLNLLEEIARDKSEPPCLRLYVVGTLVNDLITPNDWGVTHRDNLHLTVSWRSRYVSLFSMIAPGDARCRNQTCSHYTEAEKLLAELPIDRLRSSAQRLPATLQVDPPRELSSRNLAVEYVWVGWADRSEANPPEVVIRIKQENIPKTNFESALYAKLPDTEVMSVIGDLTENKAGIVPANKKEIRCGTPVYVRWQQVSEYRITLDGLFRSLLGMDNFPAK